MKTLYILTLIFLNTQIISQPLKIGIGGGFSYFNQPANFTRDVSEFGLGFSNEYNIGIKLKVNVPIFIVTPTAFINYYFLDGAGAINNNNIPLNIETSSKILSFGVGGELALLPGPFAPYLSLEAQMNNIQDIEVSNNKIFYFANYSDRSRIGLAIGLGTELSFLPIDIDMNVKYNFMNLIGKETGEQSIGIINMNAVLMFSL